MAAIDVWGVVSGDAREAAKLFPVIHLLMMLAFVIVLRSSTRHLT